MYRSTARLVPVLLAILVLAVTLTACGGNGGEDDAGGGTGGGNGANEVEVTAGDLYFARDGQRSTDTDLSFTAQPGTVTITLHNDGAALHNVVVEEAGDTTVVEAAGGETASGTIELEPGTYTIYCGIPGHRQAMEATLTVTE